jgi:HSP20 family protein
MGYVKFDPFRSVEFMARKMQQVADEIEKGVSVEFGTGFSPRIDITEDEKNVYLHAELPGVKKEDVKITINEENVLNIKGDKKRVFEVAVESKEAEANKAERTFIKAERNFGEFTRSFMLPQNLNKDSIQAKFDNGILNITLAKIEPAKPKDIEISVG